MKHSNRFTLPLILTTGMLAGLAGSAIVPVLNVMRESLSVDPAQAALIVTMHSLFIAILAPVVGMLIDRYGIRPFLSISLLIFGVAGGAGMIIDSYWLLLLSRAIMGPAAAVLVVSSFVLALNLYSGEERNKVLGWQGAVNALSAVLGPIAGGALGTVNWHLPFALFLIAIPMAGLAVFCIPKTRKQESAPGGDNTSVLKLIRTTPYLIPTYALIFMTMLLLYVLAVYGPPRLEEIGIINPLHIGLFIAALGVSAGAASMMYFRIKRHLTYNTIFLISTALWTIGLLIFALASHPALVVVSLLLFGIGQGFVFPAYPIWISEVAPQAFRGRTSSYMSSLCFLGQFAAPVFFAPFILRGGPQGVFLAASFVSLLVLVAVFLVGRKKYSPRPDNTNL